MNEAEREALATAIGFARANRIDYASDHVYKRMRQRGVTYRDVASALSNATDCRSEPQDRWRITGPDLENELISLIVAFEDGILVITVYGA